MAIIPRCRSYRDTFDSKTSRECLNWRSYEDGALTKVADSAISTVYGHGGHLGHVTWIINIIYVHFMCPKDAPYEVWL